MKNLSIKTLAGLTMAIATSTLALANPIVGSVSFFGDASLSGDTLSFSKVFTNSGTDSYAGISFGDHAVFAPLVGISLDVSNPAGQPFPVPAGNLWSFTDTGTGDTYTFAATTANQPFGSESDAQWTFFGKGVADISGPGGYTATAGTWTITTTSEGHDEFTFTGGSGVPDGGTTALLVGLGFLGMGGYALRNRRAKA